jgi:hypothetical protein
VIIVLTYQHYGCIYAWPLTFSLVEVKDMEQILRRLKPEVEKMHSDERRLCYFKICEYLAEGHMSRSKLYEQEAVSNDFLLQYLTARQD